MSDLFSDREWYALVAKPGQQQLAAEQLERQDYRAYLPMCLTERRNREKGRMETVARPLFGRYLFVGCHTEQPFRPIGNTVGVSFVVRGADEFPLRVSPLVLRRIFARCMADGGALDLRPHKPAAPSLVDWEPGQPLEVIEGPFRDFAAVLLEWADKRREIARVMVELFGRSMPMEVPVDGLRPTGSRKSAA